MCVSQIAPPAGNETQQVTTQHLHQVTWQVHSKELICIYVFCCSTRTCWVAFMQRLYQLVAHSSHQHSYALVTLSHCFSSNLFAPRRTYTQHTPTPAVDDVLPAVRAARADPCICAVCTSFEFACCCPEAERVVCCCLRQLAHRCRNISVCCCMLHCFAVCLALPVQLA
jgi:hypothetical protein